MKILESTPFGFVLEVAGDTAYYSGEPWHLLVNGEDYGLYTVNVVSVFGLEPGKSWKLEARGRNRSEEVTGCTQPLQWLINVRDYNAAGDGRSDDTAAINTAIYMAPENAVIYFPEGTYLTSQILLKSDISIYLETGCCIRHITERDSLGVIKGFQRDRDYTHARVGASWGRNPLDTYAPLILGYDVKRVKIFGHGMIDGNGSEGGWWEHPKEKKGAWRPKNMFLNRCRDICVAGISSVNSASWNIHPFYSDGLRFLDVKFKCDKDSPNTDGLNPESCRDVTVTGCHFAVGDDCIAIKSGKYFMSQYDYRPSEELLIRNCYMGDGHGGVTLGSEISCGVRRLRVENCCMAGTDRGIRIKTRRGRGQGSIVDGITIRNLKMNDVQHAVAVNMFYNCDPDGKSDYVKDKNVTAADPFTPSIRNIEISGLDVRNLHGCAVFMYGLPESPVEHVRIQDCTFKFARQRTPAAPDMLEDFQAEEELGIFIKNAAQLILKDNEFIGQYVKTIGEETTYEGSE